MRARLFFAICVASVVSNSSSLHAQITVGGTSPLTYSQNFDTPTLPSSGSINFFQFDSVTTAPTIPGWFGVRTGTGTTINANAGTDNAGALYNYGVINASDRSLGSVGSGSVGSLAWGVVFQNTGTDTLKVNVQYTGEQWRNSAAAAQTAIFSYLITSSVPTSSGIPIPTAANGVPTGYSHVASLDFTSPITGGTAGPLNGNADPNRVLFNQDINFELAANQYVVFHWSDPNHPDADHGLSIDDVTFTFSPVPEPTTLLAVAAGGLGLVSVARRRFRRGTC